MTGITKQRLSDWAKESKVVKMVDKFSLVLGVTVLCTKAFLLLEHPDHFGMYYDVLLSIMLVLQFYSHVCQKQVALLFAQFLLLGECILCCLGTICSQQCLTVEIKLCL
jgi:hypothetical protein